MNFLSIDVGTTACKCQLFNESGEILEYIAKEYDFKRIDGEIYVDSDAIEANVKAMIKAVGGKHEISSIAVSSLGEAFVLLGEDDETLFYPMLYTDPRGAKEAATIKELVGDEKVFKTTGTVPHSMYSISKLMMIKNDYPDVYARAKRVLLVADFVGYFLTGKAVIDYSLAARTGVFDIHCLKFSSEILNKIGIDESLFSTPMRSGALVGPLRAELCEELGLKNTPTFILGAHDQVATTLGAGALSASDAVDGLGTVECITALFENADADIKMGRQGYPIIPFAKEGLYCTYILNYSSGSTVNWYRKKITHGYAGDEENFFAYMEKNVGSEPSGILLLPYFGGAATPHQNVNAKGAIIGLTTETTDAELYRALLEGTALEMRYNAEVVKEYGINIKSVVATGGGANSKSWIKIKADVQNIPIKTLRSSEGGLCGCAMIQAVAMGSVKDFFEARDVFVRYGSETLPDKEMHEKYAEQYEKYKKLYATVKDLYL